MPEGKQTKDKPKKEYFYFVDNVKYETDQSTITGALIKAKIANFDSTYALFLEGVGNDPDQPIGDDTVVSLEKDHGPRRFHTVPPAAFGGHDAA
jgi:hypothetical protein